MRHQGAARQEIGVGHVGGDESAIGQPGRVPPPVLDCLDEGAGVGLVLAWPGVEERDDADQAIAGDPSGALPARQGGGAPGRVHEEGSLEPGWLTGGREVDLPAAGHGPARPDPGATAHGRAGLRGGPRQRRVEAGAVDVPAVLRRG